WSHVAREALIPGTSARWNLLGALLLVVWCHGLVEMALVSRWGSLEIFSHMLRPGWDRLFRYQFGYTGALPPAAPAGLALFGVPAAVWLVNLVVVLANRDR